MTNSIPAVASCDTAAPGGALADLSIVSTDTIMGNRAHFVSTINRDLAWALYYNALEVDLEPDIATKKGLWTVGFICTDGDARSVIVAAQGVTA